MRGRLELYTKHGRRHRSCDALFDHVPLFFDTETMGGKRTLSAVSPII